MAPTNHKKARVQAPTPLGSLLPAGTARKDESELELEEAVFGRGRGARASVWDTVAEDDALEAEQYGEDVETGLERLKDESVSASSRKLGAGSAPQVVLGAIERMNLAALRAVSASSEGQAEPIPFL
jgi:hypothetical protein